MFQVGDIAGESKARHVSREKLGWIFNELQMAGILWPYSAVIGTELLVCGDGLGINGIDNLGGLDGLLTG